MGPKLKIINREELENMRLLGTDDKVPFECKKMRQMLQEQGRLDTYPMQQTMSSPPN